jgi:general secretion pathway protein G
VAARNWINKAFLSYFIVKPTLVVLALVVCIVIVLAPLVYKKPDNSDVVTRYQLISIAEALDMYREDFGEYPTTEQGLNALAKSFGKGPYIRGEFDADAWGGRIIYFRLGSNEKASFELYSPGRNKIDENAKGDDISYWSHDVQILIQHGKVH